MKLFMLALALVATLSMSMDKGKTGTTSPSHEILI